MTSRAILAIVFLAWFLLPYSACAGVMTRDRLAAMFPAPMVVGEPDANFPVWPLFNGGAGDAKLAGWIFESADLAPIPGFSGTPPNLLIALAPDGTFLDVRVVSQHEPVFVDGLGEEPLVRFLEQYRGKALGRAIKVGSNINSAERASSQAAYIDGVSKATASVLIINQTILTASVKTARAKLGFAGASTNPGRPRRGMSKEMDWDQLMSEGLVRRIAIANGEVEKGFAGTVAEGLDGEAAAHPEANFIDLYVADPLVPTTGRALLGEAAYTKLAADLEGGEPAILIISAGRWSVTGDDWTPGSVPDRIAIKQAGLPIVVRDMAFDKALPLDGVPSQEAMILKIPVQAGFDPASPFDVVPHVTRAKGIIYPELVSLDLPHAIEWPRNYYETAASDELGDGLTALWLERRTDVAIIAAALALLTLALALQKRLTRDRRTFAVFRLGFLIFTLGFIGWHAQAQLSIVTLMGVVKTATTTGDFAFLLWDPPSLILWGFTIASFVVWGRGVFCGWLCPFGALQELIAEAARFFRIPQWRIGAGTDRWLRNIKYLALAVILAAALFPSSIAETLAEVEPFKTSITLFFVRHWPYVLYALGLIAFNLVVYKGFCRYLCPLGAAMAAGGRLRLLDWIPRRSECGTPCQLCKVKCRYGAIEKSGKIDYDECFQCLDCVAIFYDAKSCVPEVQTARRQLRMARKVPA